MACTGTCTGAITVLTYIWTILTLIACTASWLAMCYPKARKLKHSQKISFGFTILPGILCLVSFAMPISVVCDVQCDPMDNRIVISYGGSPEANYDFTGASYVVKDTDGHLSSDPETHLSSVEGPNDFIDSGCLGFCGSGCAAVIWLPPCVVHDVCALHYSQELLAMNSTRLIHGFMSDTLCGSAATDTVIAVAGTCLCVILLVATVSAHIFVLIKQCIKDTAKTKIQSLN